MIKAKHRDDCLYPEGYQCTCEVGLVQQCRYTKCEQLIAGPGTNYCLKHFNKYHGITYQDAVENTITGPTTLLEPEAADMVNHPAHYTRGPRITDQCSECGKQSIYGRTIECIEVIRHIKDFRLATAMKYIWRVAFDAKDNDREDIQKAMWFLQDWLDNPLP